MARQARQQSETDYYHVMFRGINRSYVFEKEEDKEKLIELLHVEINESEAGLAAWRLMYNHIHMAIQAKLPVLSKIIKIVCVQYAGYYNKRYKRVGPLFGDCYKSEPINDDTYLLEVIRYIHKSPVNAKISDDVSQYKWSSYLEYIKDLKYISKEQQTYIKNYFTQGQNTFKRFHKIEGTKEYLEIKEDQEQRRIDRAQRIIEKHCNKYGLEKGKELLRNENKLKELVQELKDINLPMRKIAEMINISLGKVHQLTVKKANGEKDSEIK